MDQGSLMPSYVRHGQLSVPTCLMDLAIHAIILSKFVFFLLKSKVGTIIGVD